MSQRARELCAYLKELEDGPVYTTTWSDDGPPFWCQSWPSPATVKAQFLDACGASLEYQLAAMARYINERYGSPVPELYDRQHEGH